MAVVTRQSNPAHHGGDASAASMVEDLRGCPGDDYASCLQNVKTPPNSISRGFVSRLV